MITIDRRAFLSGIAGSLFAASAEPEHPVPPNPRPAAEVGTCWLDVAAPFVIADPEQEISTDILLTATCFPGVDGYRDSRFATDYQILLFSSDGKEMPLDNRGKLEIPALRPRLVRVGDLVGRDAFFGGMKLRVAPSPHQVARAGDLFSAGFRPLEPAAEFRQRPRPSGGAAAGDRPIQLFDALPRAVGVSLRVRAVQSE